VTVRRLLFITGNGCAAAGLVLIVIDPTLPLWLFVALSVTSAVLGWLLPWLLWPRGK
jgi:hypothetical protein